MSKKTTKLIEDILLTCNADGEKYFNSLYDKSEQYLTKLLKLVRAL